MGFIVRKEVEIYGEGTLQEFYVRIDQYRILRNRSTLELLAAHFNTPDGAKLASGTYFGDQADYSGYLPTSMSFDNKTVNYNPRLIIELGEEVETDEYYTSSSIQMKEIRYVDFDDNGDEVIKVQQKEYVVDTKTNKRKQKDLSFLSGNMYSFAYEKLKAKYKEDFSPCDIEDVI